MSAQAPTTVASASDTSATVCLACAIFADIGRIPVPVKARLIAVPSTLSAGGIVASVSYSTRDPVAHKKRILHQTVITTPLAPYITPAVEDDSLALDAFHPSGNGFRAVLRTVAVGDAKKRLVEVYSPAGALLASCNVTDLHGEFYTDDQIGGMAWSAKSLTHLAYIAEAKAPKRDKVTDFVYDPDFGEGYWGKRPPVLVVVHLDGLTGGAEPSEEIKVKAHVVPLDYHRVSPSKPFFAVDDTVIGFVGYERSPKVWGIAHCPNRLSAIYTIPTPPDAVSSTDATTALLAPQPLTPASMAARCPVVSASDGSRIAFLSVPVGGPHNTCAELHLLDLTTGIVQRSIASVDGTNQPGLFVDSFTPNGPQFKDTIVATTHWRTVRTPIKLHPANGQIELLGAAEQHSDCRHESVTVLSHSALHDGARHVVVAQSGIIHPPSVALNVYDKDGNTEHAVIAPARVPPSAAQVLDSLEVITVTFSPTLEAIVVRSKAIASGTSPLVIVPHGGPHSAYANEWSDVMSPQAVGLAAGAGYTVAYVNYTGSSGYGKHSIDALLGKVGTLDVQECHHVAVKLLEEHPELKLDRENVFFLGGSHSGLIGTFIAAQYPGFYRAIVIRNPVTSLGTFTGTDILDWSFSEAGLPFDLRKPSLVTPEAFAAMWPQSGMSVIEHVNTPTLVLLGAKDARVPNFQGLEWAAWLKGNLPHVPVRVMQFADAGHGLESADAQKYGFEATVAFFEEFRRHK